MIGVFDSGYGGLSILKTLATRMPEQSFVYLGDHSNAPYGSRPFQDVYDLTTANIRWLFERHCDLVILACNTASCVLRRIQHEWLPAQGPKKRVLGVVVPTIETVTGVPWHAASSNGEAKTVGVFATETTVRSNAYPLEIQKHAPSIDVIQQACPALVPLIEAGASEADIEKSVRQYTEGLRARMADKTPDHILLGCTHYALIEDIFRKSIPDADIVSQPECVAASLEDYLARHPEYKSQSAAQLSLFTTGDPAVINKNKSRFFSHGPEFKRA